MDILDIVHAVGISGLIDIALMTVLVYAALHWTRSTRASSVATGIVLLGLLYLVARQFGLVLTATIFERFFAIILIALVILFQGEIRTVFDRLAVSSLGRMRRGATKTAAADSLPALLSRTAFDLARGRIGALVIVPGRQAIEPHVSAGVELDGVVSGPLLKSIFDHHTPGHDGAVVLAGERVARFAAHLPLSANHEARGEGGTRHAAALGISEQTDALCVVVSEERGLVSVARDGVLTAIHDEASLVDVLGEFLRSRGPVPRRPKAWSWLIHDWRLRLMALGIAAAMWAVLVYGGRPMYRTYSFPVEVGALEGGGADLVPVPGELSVTLRGPLRAFWLVRERTLRVHVEPADEPGTQEIVVTADALALPDQLAIEHIQPQVVLLSPQGKSP